MPTWTAKEAHINAITPLFDVEDIAKAPGSHNDLDGDGKTILPLLGEEKEKFWGKLKGMEVMDRISSLCSVANLGAVQLSPIF